jgi:hypothetical protein
MTVTNSFIAELIRDANRLDHLDDYQKRRMLARAVTTIRDMRETIGIPPGPGRDRLLKIQTVALSIDLGWRSDEEIRNALLLAAGIIRDLHIVLDSKQADQVACLLFDAFCNDEQLFQMQISPLGRMRQTAERIEAKVPLPSVEDDRLVEVRTGS